MCKMKNTLVKVVSGILACLMLVPAAASCKSGSDSKNTTAAEDNTPPRDTASLLAASVYAADGLDYALKTIEKYYDKRTSTVKRALRNSNAAEIWYVAAFVEMLTEAYKLYPDNETIKTYYIDALDKCLPQYEVKSAMIKNPKKTYLRQTYYNAGRGSSGDFYYDDNAWICYQFIEAYELLGDEKYLTKAEKLLEFLWTGWRIDGGGIYWDKTFGGIAVCATSPIATCHLRLYMLTEKQEYLDKAIQAYDWLNENVKGTNNLYYAGIGDNWQPSYDQGTMLINSSLLYKITGDEKYFKNARSLSNAVLNHCIEVSGSRGNITAKLKTNPYYCPWSFGWLLRGIMAFYDVSETKSESFMVYFKMIMDARRGIVNKNDQYDPYLGTGCMDWLGDGKTFSSDDVVIMPSGYSTMLLLIASFDVFQSEDALEALYGAEA